MKSQDNSVQNSGQTHTKNQTERPAILSASNALLELFEHSKASLPAEKLEWFGNLTTPAQTEVINVTKTLESLAVMHTSQDQSSLPSVEDLAFILLALSSQLTTATALMQIAESASDLAKERKAEKAAGGVQ